MLKRLILWSLILCWAAMAVAGGDTAKDRAMSGCPPCPEPKVVTRTVKGDCPPAQTCPDCVCDPCPVCPQAEVKYVDRWHRSDPVYLEPERRGHWVLGAGALYQEDPGLQAVGGYRWANGITLLGQALWLDRKGCPGFEGEVDYRHMPVEYYCPGCNHGDWGAGVLVTFDVGK